MKLTAQQVAFWEVFGYLVLPKVFDASEVDAMSKDLDEKASADRGGDDFEGERRQDVDLVEAPSFKSVLTDEKICGPLSQLLGDDFIWVGGPGGGLYVGDTQWHPDVAHVGDGKQTRLKMGLYLDPVRKETGCLRVVPGSHRNPLHDELQPMRMGRLKKAIADGSLISNIAPASDADKKELSDWEGQTGIDLDDNNTIYGTDPLDIPSAALESDPGDAVFFNQLIFHAAFGGKTGRRMVAFTWAQAPSTPEHVTGREAAGMMMG